MPRRKNKPIVGAELKREWLRLTEEEGQSPPLIAKTAGYDVRTVRRAIETAKQEREMREARISVFRRASEDHYADLVNFTKQIDDILIEIKLSTSFLSQRKNRLWSALKQHLPRSPLWRATDKFDTLNNDIGNIRSLLIRELQKKVEGEISRLGSSRLNAEGIANAVVHQVIILEGEYVPELKITPMIVNREVQINFGAYNCGTVPENRADTAKEFITNLMTETSSKPESEKLRELISQRNKTVDVIREELATIQLRRILPGRCKYCPM
jgi:hypothetical protein